MPLAFGAPRVHGELLHPILESNSRIRAASSSGGAPDKAAAAENHYQVLGLKQNANPQQIKTAFRQLAVKYHPDVNKSPDSEAVFKSLRLAYEVLSDETKRRRYNETLNHKEIVRKKKYHSDLASGFTTFRPARTRVSVYNRANQDIKEFERTYGKHKRNFTPSQKNKFNGWPGYADHLLEEWQRSRSLVFIISWTTAAVWQFFGPRPALATLGLSICSRKDISLGYKLALGVTWIIGGFKGVLAAASVLLARCFCGEPYDSAVLMVVFGFWLRESFISTYIHLPPPLLLFMAFKLAADKRTQV